MSFKKNSMKIVNKQEFDKLNAKFVNEDGREVVIDKSHNIVLEYPDKGTFNYANFQLNKPVPSVSLHNKYDVQPFNKLMEKMNIVIKGKWQFQSSESAVLGNSWYWGD